MWIFAFPDFSNLTGLELKMDHLSSILCSGEGGGEGGGGAEEEQGVDAEAGEGEAVGGPDFDELGNADDCDADYLRP